MFISEFAKFYQRYQMYLFSDHRIVVNLPALTEAEALSYLSVLMKLCYELEILIGLGA